VHLIKFVNQINKNFSVCATRIASVEIQVDKLMEKDLANSYFNIGEDNGDI
jgi:hypothetical protein